MAVYYSEKDSKKERGRMGLKLPILLKIGSAVYSLR